MNITLLFPTYAELSHMPAAPKLKDLRKFEATIFGAKVFLTGFGPINAGIGAMSDLRQQESCDLCILAGTAGTYDTDACPVGTVVELDSFQLFGVGAGNEPGLILPEEMQLPNEGRILTNSSIEYSTGEIDIEEIKPTDALTVCAASVDKRQAASRKKRFPHIAVEEMEGFAVARACRWLDIPFISVRAISNEAGDRNRKNWKIDEAMKSLGSALHTIIDKFQ